VSKLNDEIKEAFLMCFFDLSLKFDERSFLPLQTECSKNVGGGFVGKLTVIQKAKKRKIHYKIKEMRTNG
jgi:hypothetical protein